MTSLRRSIFQNSLWLAGGQLLSLLIVLSTNIWLARLLSPKEFGQVGVVMFFITLANVFAESGLGGALVRKKEVSKEDYSTVFITNLTFSLVCVIIIYFAAGFIADFYNDYSLRDILIISSSIILINAFQITQNAKIVSELKFKKRSIYRLVSVIVGSIVGLSTAYLGGGVWSLVLMSIATSATLTFLFWFSEGMFFSLRFSKKSFKSLYSFGVNTTLASLINTAFDNIYQLVLGRYFSINQVGYYYQAKKMQDVPGGIINMVSQNVFFSSLAKLQDDKKEFMRVYNNIALTVLVFMGCISGLIYLYAEQIILLLYGREWIEATLYLQLLTVASFFIYQELLNRVIFKVYDRTKQILILEMVKKVFQVISIIIGVYILNIYFLLYGFIFSSVIGYLINLIYSRRILIFSYKKELYAMLKVILCLIITIFIITFLHKFLEGYFVFLTIPLFIIIYMFFLRLFKVYNYQNILNHVTKNY